MLRAILMPAIAIAIFACSKPEPQTSRQLPNLKSEQTVWLIAQASDLYWDAACEQSEVQNFEEHRASILNRFENISCQIGDKAPVIENIGYFIKRTNPNNPGPRLDVLCHKDGRYLAQLEAIATELKARCKGKV